MWSRKPTPVARVPAPVPSRPSASVTLVSLVSRAMSARACSRRGILPYLHRRRVALEALGPRDRRAGARQRVRGGADAHLAHAPAEVARAQARRRSARRRRWAACGSSRRRSRRRRWRSRRPTKTQPALRTRGASASASAPISSRCSGAKASAKSSAASRSGASTSAAAAVPGVEGDRVEQRGVVADRADDACPRRARPGRRGRSRPASGSAPSAASTSTSDGPGEAVDADVAADQALGLLDVEVAGAGDDVGARHASRCRRRARRRRGRRPCGRPRRPRTARRRRGSPGARRARRRRPPRRRPRAR